MTHPVPAIIYLHLTAAFAALILGTVQLTRTKGTPSHKAAGWVFVALILTVAISSLWIPSFLHFTWIHIFTLVTLISVPLALWHIRRGDVRGHAYAMKGVYIGGLVVAGIFTLVPGRLIGNWMWTGVWGYPGT